METTPTKQQGEIELKHLSNYLPYGLRYSFNNQDYWRLTNIDPISHKYDFGEMVRLTMTGENNIGVKWDDEKNGVVSHFSPKNEYFKPILRTMSDLTKDHLRGAGFDSHIDYLTNELHNSANDNRLYANGKKLWRIECAPYEMVDFLFEHHFDVFGLIPAGLAIDINMLNP